jgi:hypothetical protein
VVLNIGLDLGVLSPTLFTMFVVMAVVTTAATSPILSLVLGPPRAAERVAVEPPARVGEVAEPERRAAEA